MGQRFTAVVIGREFSLFKIVSCDLVVCGGKCVCFSKESRKRFFWFPCSRMCDLYIHYNDTSSVKILFSKYNC
jgi:hypothetical protein